MPTFQQQAAVWGQAYEILVKRGVLGCLADHELVDLNAPHLEVWRNTKLLQVYKAVVRELDIIDETVRQQTQAALHHLSVSAYGVGYTAMRAYLRQLTLPLEQKKLAVKGIWCPLTLPGPGDFDVEREKALNSLVSSMGLHGPVDPAWADKGQPARADFILWLSGSHKEDHLLIQEYSYDMPQQVGDFRSEYAHLDELARFRRMVDSRGVFAHVSAEVEEESFELSSDIKSNLSALTSDNKPFYKLCQGAAYATSTLQLLEDQGLLAKPCLARALAITPNGLESLAARYAPAAPAEDPRLALMRQMGDAYKQASKIPEGDEDGLTRKVSETFQQILMRLPKNLRNGIRELRAMPIPGAPYRLEFEEPVPAFANPMQRFSRDEALAMVVDTPSLEAYFGQPARTAISTSLDAMCGDAPTFTLRDLHAAAIGAGMRAAQKGKLNVLGLEGNPGIGKTTAVIRHLAKREGGYLFLYVSPRVIINRDVTEKMGRKDGAPSGILTVTTNSDLISAAPRFHTARVENGLAKPKHIDAAVVADGVYNLKTPEGSVLVLTPEEELEIENHHAGSRFRKNTLSENEDMVDERRLLGVLSAMSSTTRELLELNPLVDKTVMTAALQGFREKAGGKTTVSALSSLFKEHRDGPAKRAERARFAARMPTIVVMVDELAGDGAGAPFVHAVAEWLRAEFIEPFDGNSPFTVVLVISDASLGNEVVLDRYLNAGNRTPDKVLVSKSRGPTPFSLAATKLKLGGPAKALVLHVMTNSYPASELKVRYQVNLTTVQLTEKQPGFLESPRQAVRREADEQQLRNAVDEVQKAVAGGASQVIYFAQDKLFLRSVREALVLQGKNAGLTNSTVKILDSSIPGPERKRLIEDEVRDSIKVFLMTSSGARGVSFPKTDCIIASVPRFSVEASLMELAQLIYRGRGMYRDAEGQQVSGDNVPRQLVMLVNDFLVYDKDRDQRQWLRQSMDLMTLLVMLRATIFTRIKGDAGLSQPLALVPVGGVGVDELLSLMSQHVLTFLSEADTYVRGTSGKDKAGMVAKARTNCYDLFSKFRLQALAREGAGVTFVRPEVAREFFDRASSAIAPLFAEKGLRPEIPDHIYFEGPLVLENWADFDKREVFTFEGHRTSVDQMARQLFMQLREIDETPSMPSSLRKPASNLLRLLSRDKPGAANEFSTIKLLKSPKTWLALPASYLQFMGQDGAQGTASKQLKEPELWLDYLGRALVASNAVMPAIPRFESMPWAAGVGSTSPLKLDVVFDDRYFMASNELNLLNALLLTGKEN